MTTLGTIEAQNVATLAGLEIDIEPARRSPWERRLVETWGAGQESEWKPGQPRCKGCTDEIDPTPLSREIAGMMVVLPVTVCEDCMKLVRAHYSTSNEPSRDVSLTPKWDEECPMRFREVIEGETGLPPAVARASFDRVKAWRPKDGKGLALVGTQGSGKSLSLWALARELEREGCAPVVVNGVEFGRQLARAARDIESVEYLCRCRVLMIDDLGKEKATAAVGALMWEVVDQRYQRRLPMIITTRFSGQALRDRFSEPHLGDDIRRRLNELCRAVHFEIQGETQPETQP